MRTNFPKPDKISPFEPYRDPWETAKEGYWVVYKKDGCTSMKRIEDPAFEQVEAALAECYDIMVTRMMKFRETEESFSASDFVLDTIKGLRQVIMKKSLTS